MFDGDGFQYRYMELKNLLKLINMYPYTLRIKIDTKKKKKKLWALAKIRACNCDSLAEFTLVEIGMSDVAFQLNS